MVGYYSQGVPTTAELENNSNQKKYTVNKSPRGDLLISRPVCALFVMGALLMAAVAAVITFCLLPRCESNPPPETLRDATAGSDQPVVEYVRLPRSVEPTHYRLNIRPFLTDNFTTHGNVTITLKVKKDTDKIVFNVRDIKIEKSSLNLKTLLDGKNINIKKQSHNEEEQTYTLLFEENLEEGQIYELQLKFIGKLNDLMVGFYRSKYSDSNNLTRWLASTQFSPIDARRAFPCFDEPFFKAKYRISIARPIDMSTLSNMPRIDSTVILSENVTWDNYEETPPMSSYLVAFTVHDFIPYRHNSSEKLFTIWSRRDRVHQAVFAMNMGPKILQFFENYFDIKYPLPKIDIVAVPDFGFSAMENWGLITFRETKLLFDEKSSTIQNKRDIAVTLSHELAHQWFGNLVTPQWWDDLWLKEGFASYFEYLGVDQVEPHWKIQEEFYFSETAEAFKLDQLKSSRPIHFKVQNNYDITQAFDSISYCKGASLVKMVANFLGQQTFKDGLKKFLTKHQYSNATHDDVWDALTEQAHVDGTLHASETVKDVMNTWTEQAGFPVLTVTGNYKENTISINQRRFLINGESVDGIYWHVPVSYIIGSVSNYEDKKPKVWLKGEKSITVSVNLTSWYLFNLNQDYYIVNYDEKNWKALINNVMNFPPVIRAQLVSDSMDLARAGLLDYDIPLRLITTIGRRDREITFVPLLTIFEKLSFLYNVLYSTSTFGKFESYVWYVFNFAFENVRFDDSNTDTYITQRIRRLVLEQACLKQDPRCTIDARLMYRGWMTEGHTVPPNLREVVYCTAIREGGEAEWDFAYKIYMKTKSASDKVTLLRSLGCSSKQWILARYLDMMLKNDSGIRKQDGAEVFKSVAKNFYGYNLAFDFLRSNWDRINEYYGVAFRTVSKMVEYVSTYMNTPHHLQQLEAFKKENKYNLRATEQAFDNALDAVRANVKWMNVSYTSVELWLNGQFDHYGL